MKKRHSKNIQPGIAIVLRDRIRKLRQQYALTQEELCFKAGISIDAISRIEGGSRTPSLTTIERIATAFDLPVAALLQTDMPLETKYSASVNKIIKLVEDQPEHVNGALAKIIKHAINLYNESPSKKSSSSSKR